MIHNRFGYYIKEGIESIFTHGFMSFASVCIIVACLIIMGSFSLLSLNVESIIHQMENENQILAYVDETLPEESARNLQSLVEDVPNVQSAQFVSREEAWESFTGSYQNSSLFDALDASTVRSRYVIFLDDISLMAKTRDDLMNVPGIAGVNAHLEISEGFMRIRNVVTTVSVVLVAILFVISLFIMSNTIKLTTFERKDEIAIMKMVGATPAFIRWPFVVEGLVLSTFGSLSAFILQYGIYRFVTDKVINGSGISFLTTIPFYRIAVPLLVVYVVIGFSVGVIGSLIAIKNYLKV